MVVREEQELWVALPEIQEEEVPTVNQEMVAEVVMLNLVVPVVPVEVVPVVHPIVYTALIQILIWNHGIAQLPLGEMVAEQALQVDFPVKTEQVVIFTDL